jgi:hypothetical protein
MKVAMWGDTQESLGSRLSGCLASYKWQLISIEKAEPVGEEREYSTGEAEIIERASSNEKAIILGEVFSYRTN